MIKAILTGHSRGLGAAIAQSLLTRGVSVLGISRHGNAELAGKISEVALDLADAAALERWLASDALGEFTSDASALLLINNAGLLAPVGALTAQVPGTIAQAITCNVSAALMLSAATAQVVANRMSTATELRILHISSGAGRNGIPGWSVYGAGKAALDHHARAVKADNIPGLRICSLAPGVIDTDMQAQIRATPAENFPLLKKFETLKASGGLSTPKVCAAEIVAHLLSADFGAEPVADIRELASGDK